MNKILLILGLMFISIFLNASIFDFIFLDKAKTNYEDGNYKEVLKNYDEVDLNNSEIIYNRGNSLYKLKKYEEAKKLYESLKDKKLSFQKWHNIGNASAKLGQIDYGIKAYEIALKIKDSDNTRFNLELLKKEKSKNQENNESKENQDSNNSKENQENNESKQNQDSNNSKENKQNKDSNNSKQNQENNQTKPNQEQNSSKQSEENNKTKENEEQNSSKLGENNQSRENNETNGTQKPKVIYISEKEMRKYQEMLDKRGVNTLMLPFNRKSNGENDNELKPW